MISDNSFLILLDNDTDSKVSFSKLTQYFNAQADLPYNYKNIKLSLPFKQFFSAKLSKFSYFSRLKLEISSNKLTY